MVQKFNSSLLFAENRGRLSGLIKPKKEMITKTPTSGASLFGELIFGFEDSDNSGSIVVTITDIERGEELMTRVFEQSASCEIDIAPLLRRTMHADFDQSRAGFWHPSSRVRHIRVSDSDSLCESYFVAAVECDTDSQLLTSMPRRRLISPGERDEFLLRSVKRVDIMVTYKNGVTMQSGESALVANIPYCYTFTTEDFTGEESEVEITFLLGDNTQERFHYTVVEPIPDSVRVVWLSRSGSVERYTFPIVVSRRESQSSQWVAPLDSEAVMHSAEYAQRLTLMSALELSPTLEALAQIGTSPFVAIEGIGGEYVEVESLPEEFTTTPSSTVGTISVTLKQRVKHLKLWS